MPQRPSANYIDVVATQYSLKFSITHTKFTFQNHVFRMEKLDLRLQGEPTQVNWAQFCQLQEP